MNKTHFVSLGVDKKIMTSHKAHRLPTLIWVGCFLLHLFESVCANHIHLAPIEPQQGDDAVDLAYEPLSYNLSLIINTEIIDNSHYYGSVRILLQKNESDGMVGEFIKLHLGPKVFIHNVAYYDIESEPVATYLDTDVNLERAESIRIHTLGPWYDAAKEMMHIRLMNRPKRSRGILVIDFASNIPLANHDERQGIFYMPGWGSDGYVISNFGEGLTRQVFPCFDMAKYRVPLTINTGITGNYEIYSTARFKSQTRSAFVAPGSTSTNPPAILDGRYVKFQPTEPIAFGWFAFALGPFRQYKKTWNKGVPMKIIGPETEGSIILQIMKRIAILVNILQEYTGAMVNDRGVNIVVFPQSYGQPRRYHGLTIAGVADLHVDQNRKDSKLSQHMIVGNLAEIIIRDFMYPFDGREPLEPEDKALNEGLVSLMKHELVHNFVYNCPADFYTDLATFNLLLDMDSSKDSKSINELAQSDTYMHDVIYRAKSAALIRMMLSSFNEDMERTILRNYRYGINPIERDLIHSRVGDAFVDLYQFLREFVPNWSVENLQAWIKQPGMPIIYMSFSSPNIMTLRQERLELDPKSMLDLNENTNKHWTIPITWTLSDGGDELIKSQLTWMDKNFDEAMTITLPDWFEVNNPFHFIKLNHKMQGYYRVSYPKGMIERMQMSISRLEMDPLDRLDMLTNVGLMWEADVVDSEFFIHFLSWYRYEPLGIVSQSLVFWFRRLLQRFIDLPVIQGQVKKFGITLFNRIYKKYNLRSFSDLDMTSAHETSLIEVHKTLINLEYENLIADARWVQARGLFELMKDVPRLLASAALTGQPDFMALHGHTIMAQAVSKSETDQDLMVFMAAMLPDVVIPHLWKHMGRIYLRFHLIQTLVSNGKCLKFLADQLISELKNCTHEPARKNILNMILSVLLSADENTIMYTRDQEFPGNEEIMGKVLRKFVRRKELSIRDSEKVMSFFNNSP